MRVTLFKEETMTFVFVHLVVGHSPVTNIVEFVSSDVRIVQLYLQNFGGCS